MSQAEAQPTDWWLFIQGELDRRGWTGADFERHTGILQPRLVNWRKGSVPTIELAKTVAKGLDLPLLQVYLAAGFLSPDDLNQPVAIQFLDTSQLTNQALLRELARRLEATRADRPGAQADVRPPTRQEIAADPSRYEVGSDSLSERRASQWGNGGEQG
jgi:transcriptional regulator with XRE-family HTH domain